MRRVHAHAAALRGRVAAAVAVESNRLRDVDAEERHAAAPRAPARGGRFHDDGDDALDTRYLDTPVLPTEVELLRGEGAQLPRNLAQRLIGMDELDADAVADAAEPGHAGAGADAGAGAGAGLNPAGGGAGAAAGGAAR